MSIDNYKMITCDICGCVDYYPTTSNKIARDTAKIRAGWVYINGADICKECYSNAIKRIKQRGQDVVCKNK